MPNQDYEITFEVRVKSEETQLLNEISSLNGIKSAVMLSYDGKFTA
ncbi:hypothetical protein [Desulfuribacillus stibiiarsenatis]|nr:hypothetical protein [Desulfuribacillus stibiiarsenatis]